MFQDNENDSSPSAQPNVHHREEVWQQRECRREIKTLRKYKVVNGIEILHVLMSENLIT